MTNEYNWLFGDGHHIAFPSGGAAVVQPAPTTTFNPANGSAAVSDLSGSLLFYTDGEKIWDRTHTQVSGPALGGSSQSAMAAIILPPKAGSNVYHVFAAPQQQSGPIHHSAVTVAGTTVSSGWTTTPLTMAGSRFGEQFALISHEDCERYWLVHCKRDSVSSYLVDPTTLPSISPGGSIGIINSYERFCMAASTDGTMIAYSSNGNRITNTSVRILDFNRSTGALALRATVGANVPSLLYYGVEFSQSGDHLYFTTYGRRRRNTRPPTPAENGKLFRFDTALTGNQPLSMADHIWTRPGPYPQALASIRRAPDGTIFGVVPNDPALFAVADPDNLVGTAAGVAFNPVAISLPSPVAFGLPSFPTIASECRVDPPEDEDNACERLAAEVDATIKERFDVLRRPLPYCDPDRERPAFCEPVDLPRLEPVISIVWGRSDCDSIESDDVETLLLTVSNPYSNLTFCDVKIHKVTVVDADGNPVPILPDGTPSVELIPIGPYCFGRIEPCEYTTREFVVRTRGAVAGPYHVRVEGICFEICIHGDMSECFVMDVCAD